MKHHRHTSMYAYACAIVLAAGAVLLFSTGCQSGQTTSGTEYGMTATRALEAHLSSDLDSVHDAVVQAVEDLGFTLTSQRKDAFDSRVEAEMADETDVTIAGHRIGDNATRITIKVGLTGDEGRSRSILNEIEDNLD